jgi:molybdopterin converting factor small subunit
VVRDIALGATCGIAALGIAAAAFPGAFNHSRDARVTLAAGAYRLSNDSDNSGTIAVRVKAYGSLRSVIGGPSVGLTIPHGTTVAELSGRLADQYPGLAPLAMLAVNDGSEMLPLNAVLTDGQSVELIPPMSGG